jgi:hypothetical protein
VAIRAGIRNFVLIGHGRADKSERVASNVHISDGLFDFRFARRGPHVVPTGNAGFRTGTGRLSEPKLPYGANDAG